jgi:transcription antitermination factor NusG
MTFMDFEPQNQPQDTQMSWYAITVTPHHERCCALSLRSKGYEEFVPVYRSRHVWSDRVKTLNLPLFAGYVFCRFDLKERLSVLNTPGIRSIVSAGKSPAPVAEDEILALRRIVSSGVGAEPYSFVGIGHRVRILDGPLHGLEGILTEIKGHQRLVVSITLLRRSVSVEVDSAWVGPKCLGLSA